MMARKSGPPHKLSDPSSIPHLGLASQTIMSRASLRTSLLVRCTDEEAAAIRGAAKRERRTISSYVLHAVLDRIAHQKQLEEQWRKTRPGNAPPAD
jgi:hypothetical protein